MRVLVFHGYLLRGTGSNVYTANIAATLVRLGHEVHLICQDRHADELEFVGAVGDWDSGELVVTRVGESNCTVYRPDIGGILPVYVRDRYEGVEARLFAELSDEELGFYLSANVRAVQEVAARSDPEVALANHLVMGPAILGRALRGTDTSYAVKVHGSALEYTVKPNPRFLPYAHEGLAEARGVLVGSRHVAESLWAALDDDALPERTRLGPPGVDVRSFRPRERDEASAGVRAVVNRLREVVADAPRAESAFSRDDSAVAAALEQLVALAQSAPVVAFVGKLIVAKGIDLLLAAWPLVLEQVPSARLLIVGFGAYGAAVERWIDALSSGDLEVVDELAGIGRAAEGGPRSSLEFVRAFFERLRSSGREERYLAAASSLRERVIRTGRLEHGELVEVLALCDALVVPSTFPESFGMVAVEAAACGAFPVSAEHSGLAEVSRTLAQALPDPVRELVSFPLGPEAVESIASRVTRWLGAAAATRTASRSALVETVRQHYSWEGVARGVIAAARGELDQLDPVR